MGFSLEKAVDLLKRSLSLNSPHHVQWMLTRRCNYRCRGCTVWQEEHDTEPEITTEEVKAGLDILRELGVIEVVFSGGNPLLRDDIGEIVSYASKYFVTTVYDNGSMALKKIDELRDADF
ncbi:radical SAM protein, partial [Candidatus Bathyarchaeota archaeon]|nr:radical SAM protein [Candidatus Bathyarchaeota archaeon]